MVKKMYSTNDGQIFDNELAAEEHEAYTMFFMALNESQQPFPPEEPIAISLAILKMNREVRTYLYEWLIALNEWEDEQDRKNRYVDQGAKQGDAFKIEPISEIEAREEARLKKVADLKTFHDFKGSPYDPNSDDEVKLAL